MKQTVLQRRSKPGHGLEQLLAAIQSPAPPQPFQPLPNTPETFEAEGSDGFTLASFTTDDALELGTLLHARLRPFADAGKPTVVDISLANSSQVLFHVATGPGTAPDNELWVARKRASVLRFGRSTWFQHCKYAGDEAAFAAKFALGPEQAGRYAIHGGAVPLRGSGVEGIVAVVVVSGLKQDEDHQAIAEVIRTNWE